ncbi:hypothetical protein AB0H00_29940 [Nocardia sp. NPDC023852]
MTDTTVDLHGSRFRIDALPGMWRVYQTTTTNTTTLCEGDPQ